MVGCELVRVARGSLTSAPASCVSDKRAGELGGPELGLEIGLWLGLDAPSRTLANAGAEPGMPSSGVARPRAPTATPRPGPAPRRIAGRPRAPAAGATPPRPAAAVPGVLETSAGTKVAPPAPGGDVDAKARCGDATTVEPAELLCGIAGAISVGTRGTLGCGELPPGG